MGQSEPFVLRFTLQAEKDLADLRPHAERVLKAVAALKQDPRRGHNLSGTLRGARSLEFSLPGGACRAAYVAMQSERTCLVFLIGYHEGFYKRAERRFAALQRREDL